MEAALLHEKTLAFSNELHDRFDRENVGHTERMTMMVGACVRVGMLAGFSKDATLRGIAQNLCHFDEVDL